MKPLWYIVAFLSAVLFLCGCKEEEHQGTARERLPQVEVTVAQVRQVPVADQRELLGTVESKYRAEISAKVSGTITDLPVVLGSEVAKGELLLQISAGEIDARLQQSQAQLHQARRNLEREKKLLAKNAATPESVKSLGESLAIAEAAYQEARVIQSYTRIEAPFAGRVTKKLVNIGDLAKVGKPLLNIEDESLMQVTTDIPEALILKVKQGEVLLVAIPSAGLTVTGTVAEVAPTADPATRSGQVKLTIDSNPDLRSGQFARVTLAMQEAKTLTVPGDALVNLGQMERLFVVDDGKARLRLVRSGKRYGDHIEILSGVNPGEQVVISGQQQLRDGQPITVR